MLTIPESLPSVMNRTTVADWQELLALYEQASALDPDRLAAWMADMRTQANPLLPRLEQILAARAEWQDPGYLAALPELLAPAALHQPSFEWAPASRIGPYVLIEKLGQGGMAEVWLARRDDGVFERRVAIKLLFRHAGSTASDSFAQRFARERNILASLHHPNIAGMHDAGVTAQGQPWLALEYVEGAQIAIWCDTHRLNVAARVRLFRQVLLAVQHAHANLIIHRDLKPGNILVTAQGEVRLLDFGIAKLMEPEGGALVETELTRMAGRPMTPEYASPEQLRGEPLSTACDVYSLGVVLYELLCGDRPYELKVHSAAQLEQAILDVEPRAPSRRLLPASVAAARATSREALRKALGNDLDAITLHALAKHPLQRYASVEALRADLDRWLAGQPVEARAPSLLYRCGKFVQRHRLSVTLGVGGVLTLIGVTVVAVAMGLQARQDSARASAAKDFMLGLFQRAGQEKARGADITARELLDAGRRDLLTRWSAQPRLQAELLQGIGVIQKDMGEYVGADSTFSDSARIYDQLGMPREAALARTAQAKVAVRMGNAELAQTTLQRAQDAPGRPRGDAELDARMNEVEGWIAVLKGEMEQAQQLFRRSHDRSITAFGPDHAMTMDALRGRIYVEQRLGNFDGALDLMRLLESTAATSPDVDAKERMSIAVDRAELLNEAGHYRDLLVHLQSELAKCVVELGPNHVDCRELTFRRVDALLQLGLAAQALNDIPTLEALASDHTSPELGAGALLLMLRLQTAAGSPDARAGAFERVRSLASTDAVPPLRPSLRAKMLLTLAEASLRANQPEQAGIWIAQAHTLLRRGDGSVTRTRAGTTLKSLQGVLMLETGRAADAKDRLLAAQEDWSQLLGPDHPTTCLSSLNVAIALARMGYPQEALARVERVQPTLRTAFGDGAPTYLRVLQLRRSLQQSVESAAHDGSGAASSASRLDGPWPAPGDFYG